MQEQAKGQAVFHLFEEIDAELPFWKYFQIFRAQPYAYFLDSSLAGNALGMYSFMGGDPFLVYKAFAGERTDKGATTIDVTLLKPAVNDSAFDRVDYQTEDLFTDLRRVFEPFKLDVHNLKQHRVSPEKEAEAAAHMLPFYAGGVGYLGYEAGALIEHIPFAADEDTGLPLVCLLLVDFTLCYCHNSEKTYLSVVGRGEHESSAERAAIERCNGLIKAMRKVEEEVARDISNPAKSTSKASPAVVFTSQHDKASYCGAVEQIKKYIHEGSAYEVCLTHEYSAPQLKEPWALYQALRRINPAPFSSFLKLPEVQVVCSSPERFLHLDKDRLIESRPIKGTRRRGESELHDLKLEDELRSSEKDRAENLMIVDLVRNDLGRVSEIGSVHVPEFFKVERYATVLQLVSVIRGVLKKEYDAFDLIRACFPGGSMTGAPKIEAMKIIASLEKSRRGIYSGAIGYIDFSGTLDLNIVIRSIVVTNGRCYFNVGGAVTSDSDPAAEYEETLDKARALVAALRE